MDRHGQHPENGMMRRLAVLLGSATLVLPLAEPVGQRSGAVARYLLAMAATAMATPVQAQTVTTLVSNSGSGSGGNLSANQSSQAFTTGANAGGYTLSSIVLYDNTWFLNGNVLAAGAGFVNTNANTVTLHQESRTGAKVADFTSVVSEDGRRLTLTPTSAITLAASTTYVIVTSDDFGTAKWGNGTFARTETGLEGWSIDNDRETLESSGDWRQWNNPHLITVSGTTVANAAPTVANEIADQTATVGTAFSFVFPENTFNDGDDDTLTYTVKQVLNGDETDLPGWLSFATTRTFSGTPQASDIGTITVKVTASDGTASVSDEFDIVVVRPNTPPTSQNSTVTVIEDKRFLFYDSSFTFTDSDGDSFNRIIITALPASGKGTLSDSGGVITMSDLPFTMAVVSNFNDGNLLYGLDEGYLGYDPPVDANGNNFATFKFKVNDGEDDSTAEYTMTIDITAVNDAPTVANGIADQTVAVGGTLSLTIPDDAFDDVEDDDSLTYEALLWQGGDTSNLPSWLTFTTATFEGTPGAGDVGTITVQVTATDSGNATVNDRFEIEVVAAPDTEAPTVVSIMRSSPTTSPTNENELEWLVQFSEVVENVNAADFTVSGTSATVSGITDSTTEPGVLYLVTVSGGDLDDYDGPVTLGFASGQNIQDEAGNTLTATTPTGTDENSYEMDNTAPMVSITAPETTATAEFTITISFSEEVNGFAENDIDVSTTSGDYGTSFTAITPGQEWRFGVTLAVDNEVATISIPAGVAQDDAGNDNSAAQQVTTTYTIPNTPPTSQNSTVTVTEDTRYTFSSSEFSFTDDDNDSFSRVIITSLPAAGKGNLNALESGNVVAASDLPYNFTPADIDDDSFGYTPPANANGGNFTTFKFKVNDGEDDSTAEYTMTINITAVNDAPTVANGIADQTVAVGGHAELDHPGRRL